MVSGFIPSSGNQHVVRTRQTARTTDDFLARCSKDLLSRAPEEGHAPEERRRSKLYLGRQDRLLRT